MNLDNLRRDDWIVGGLALLLVVCLFSLPWFDFTFRPLTATFTATDGPDGWTAILGALAALAIVADLGIERLSPETELPVIGGSREATRSLLAAVAAGLVALKFLLHINFSGIVSFGWGFYVDVIVAAALVYCARRVRSGEPLIRSRPPASTSRRRRPPTSSPPRGS